MDIKTLVEIVRNIIAKEPSGVFSIYLYLKSGRPPFWRSEKESIVSIGSPVLSSEDIRMLTNSLMGQNQQNLSKKLTETSEVHFSHRFINDECIGGFVVNAFLQQKLYGAVIRVIPKKIPTIDEIGLSSKVKDSLKELSSRKSGFILIVGPPRWGKTIIATAIINYINENRAYHIITIEDPIEFIHKDRYSIINQRELGTDAESFPVAIRDALRHDPDVIFVGEMKDQETILAVLEGVEGNCLIITNIESNVAKNSVNQVINLFSQAQQKDICIRLVYGLQGIIYPNPTDGLPDVMLCTPEVKKAIIEGYL